MGASRENFSLKWVHSEKTFLQKGCIQKKKFLQKGCIQRKVFLKKGASRQNFSSKWVHQDKTLTFLLMWVSLKSDNIPVKVMSETNAADQWKDPFLVFLASFLGNGIIILIGRDALNSRFLRNQDSTFACEMSPSFLFFSVGDQAYYGSCLFRSWGEFHKTYIYYYTDVISF